ncbi:hypothetical protein [Ornithinimicrobium flavum]|nr:hypothetical protein [Ornithinimicrobium flavum]
MRPREQTDDRPALAGLLVVVPARDEEDEVAGVWQPWLPQWGRSTCRSW